MEKLMKSLSKLVLFITAIAFSGYSLAYVGPGAGLSAIGSFVAIVLALVVAVIGFVWYPLKRFFNKGKDDPFTEDADDTEEEANNLKQEKACADKDAELR
jgi:hypothetical protein